MPLNPYDEAVDALPTSPRPAAPPRRVNPYDAFVPGADELTAIQARINRGGTEDVNPDARARAMQVAREFGVTSSWVDETHVGHYERLVEERRELNAIAQSPALTAWLAGDPDHAAISRGDLRTLSALERTLDVGSNLSRAAAAGVLQASRGFWGTVQAASEGLGLEGLGEFARGTGDVAAQMQTDLRGPQRGAGFVERSVYSGVESLGLAAAGLAVTAATGGGGATFLGTLGVATGGQAYAEARAQGVGPGLAATYAAGQGAIEVATERLPVKWIVKDIAAHSGLVRTLLHQAAAEIPGEQVATALQDLNDWLVLPANQDRTLADFLAERPSAAAQTLIATVVGVVGQSAVARAIDATLPQDVLAAVAEAATASQTLKRDPASVRALVDAATAGGGVETVHLPVDTFTEYFQSQKLDPSVMAERLTGDAEAYRRAQQTGEDLAVPMSRWVTEVAATPHNEALAREARFRPDQLNARETQALEHAVATEAATAMATPESPATPIANIVAAQLEAIGVEPSTAAANAAIWQHAFGSLAERAGVDPVQLFERYGLQVTRAGLPTPGDSVGPPMVSLQGNEQPIGPVPDSEAPVDETPAQRERRRQTHEAQLLAAVLRDARTVDPHVNLDEVRAEFAFRRGLLDEQQHARLESGRDPLDLLRAVAAAGGLGPESAGGLTGERRMLGEGQAFGRVHGVPGVFRAAQTLDTRGQVVSGLGFDVMVQRLQQEPRFRWIETTDQLIDAIDDAIRQGPADDAFPGSDTIARALGIRAGEAWWRDGWRGPRELAQDERGRIAFGSNRQFRIELLKGADLSTFLHESAHFFLEVQGDVVDQLRAQAPSTLSPTQQQLVADYQTVLAWVGAESRSAIGAVQHEQFARGFEAYLLEGHAPSVGLRSVFARVRAWLVGVYGRTSRRLRVTLTADVRAVMDRLLATDAAIEVAAKDAAVAPLFTDAIAAAVGLTGDELRAYKETVDRAGEAARDRLSRALLAEWQREREAWWQEERAVERAHVVNELRQDPTYRALALLQRGTTPEGGRLPAGVERFRLSKEALVAQFGPEVLSQLPRPLVYIEGGVDPSVAAEILGFPSGPALVHALVSVEPFERAVDAATDARMRSRYGDVLLDGTLSEEARRAVLEGGAEVFATELQALEAASRRTGQPRLRATPIAVLRDIAEQRIASTPIRNVRPSVFAAAAARAGRRALEAASRQDFPAALEAQQQKILNAELSRAALAARELVDQARASFQPIFARDAALATRANMDLVAAARALLVKFGLGTPTAGAESAFVYLEQVRKYDPETYADLEAAIEAASQPDGPYQALTVDAFVAVRDAVQNVWHLAKRSKEIELEGRRHQIDEVGAELQTQLEVVNTPRKRAGYDRALTQWEKSKLTLLGFRAALRRVESWVEAVDLGDPLGPFRRILWTPISEAGSAYRVAKRTTLERYQAVVRAVEPTIRPGEIAAPEIRYTFRDKAELLHAVLHSGNASNLSKLLRGRGWGHDLPDGTLDRSRWDALLARFWRDGTLTKADYDYAQGTWDLLEALKPDAQRTHHAIYGYYFSEITAAEVRTPFGTYRGGYVPALVDVDLAPDAALRADRSALEEGPSSFMFPTTGRGFTKARVEAYAKPLLLDLRVVPAHIDKVLRFVHLEPRIKDAARLITSKGLRRALDAFDPAVAGELLVPWLQRSARQTVSTPSQGHGGRGADRMLRTLRSRVGLQLMAGNVINAAQQITGLSSALVKVRPGYLVAALGRYLRAPRAVARDIAERSPFMDTRTGTSSIELQQSIDDVLLNPSKFEQARAFAVRHGYLLQSATQNIVDTITWSGAYEQATADGATEREAVRQADAAVRATQGSFNPEDQSKFETGSAWLRVFAQFYAFFNGQANTLGTEFAVTAHTMGLRKGAGRLLYLYVFGFMVPAVLADGLVRAASGEPWDDDNDGLFDDLVLKWFLGSQGRALTALVPIVGPVAQAGLNQFNDKWGDDRISLSPAVQAIEASIRAPEALYKMLAEGHVNRRSVRDALTLIGLLSGLPTGAAARPLGYAADVATGETEPSSALDAARGAVVGR